MVNTSNPSCRALCFIYNNPTELPAAFLKKFEDHRVVRYVIFQLEEGENGTPHYQGYVELTGARTYSWFHNAFVKCHVERRKGTRDQARDYCRKEDSRKEGPFECGDWSSGGAGSRTDLAAACLTAKGGSLKRVAEEHPESFVRYAKGSDVTSYFLMI